MVFRCGGIEILTELMTLEYCDILHQVLMLLQVCLSNNGMEIVV